MEEDETRIFLRQTTGDSLIIRVSSVLICGCMNLTTIDAPDFDLAKTLDSGQVFHWESLGSGFVGMIDQQPVYAEQQADELLVSHGTAPLIRHYFALDHPLREICAALPVDPAMSAARDYCGGLRIIRQPIWECLATFITSSMKQVAHIRQMSRALRQRFGTRRMICGSHVYAFPSARRLARTTENRVARMCARVSRKESSRNRTTC